VFGRLKVLEFQRAGLLREGRLVRVLGPGIHWWVRDPAVFLDVRRQDLFLDMGPVFTREAVPVGLDVRMVWRVAEPERALGQRYGEFLDRDARAAVYRAVSTRTTEALAAEHNALEAEIRDRLSLDSAEYGVRIEDVAILEVRYPRAIRRRLKRAELIE
jgi:regulator of protease activity HflC (stomatin/prohibitin superfamily)